MIDKQLLNLLGDKKKYIFLSSVMSILALISSLAITAAICISLKNIYDGQREINEYILPIILIIAGIGVRFIASIYGGKMRGRLGAKVKKDLRASLYSKILDLGTNACDELPMSGLTQLSGEGIEQLDAYYSIYLPQFFYAMSAPIILFIVTAFIDLKTAFVLLACVPLIPVSIIAVSRFAKRIFNKYWDKYISMGGEFLDSIQGMRELKIFEADERQNTKINKSAEEFRRITMKVLVMQLFSIMIMDLVAFGGAGAGIAMAINSGGLGLNPFYLLFIVLTAVEFFLPLRAFGSAFHVGMNGAQAGKKILKILGAKNPEWGDKNIDSISQIEIKDAYFAYDESKTILSGINMTFKQNQFTAIVGESGSGKSTIVKLLTGERRINEGVISVNEQSLYNLNRKSYYSRIALVSGATYVFNDTVRNNFKVYKPDVTDEEMKISLKKMQLYDFVLENGGFDKRIAEDAENISGGQKQRLSLALNLVNNKDVYIFDEATSNIDSESEAIIMASIRELAKFASVILISHRLENVVLCDNIYVLADGQLMEEGTHANLLSLKGHYAKLYETQKAMETGIDGGDLDA